MLGLRRGTVALYPHETEWETEAARTIAVLRAILGDVAGDIQHVGSTAIKTIMAKPIVDIAVAAEDFDRVLEKQEPLERAGFYYRGVRLEGQLLFACGSFYDGSGDLQTHFIHVVPTDSRDWHDYIRFRDCLNANPSLAKEYESLKLSLAREAPVDGGRERYLAGKHAFVQRTLRTAALWALLGKWLHIVIDRPVGYVHQTGEYKTVYPVNYGYLPDVPGGDGEEQDAYLLGVNEPVAEADAVVIGIVRRKNDAEDKLIAAPEGTHLTKEEMEKAVSFQEQWFETEIIV